MLLYIPQHAYALANTMVFQVFDGLGGGSRGGVGRRSHRHYIRPERKYIEKIRVFLTDCLIKHIKIYHKIRCALHIVTTQELPVGGGKEGGILYFKKIYDTGFGVYTPQDQRSRRTTSY